MNVKAKLAKNKFHNTKSVTLATINI